MRQRVFFLFAVVALVPVASGVPAGAQEQTSVTVDTTSDVVDFGGNQMVADLPGPDGQISLREAAIATTNTEGPETIAFAIPTSDPGFDGEGFVIRIEPASAEEALTLGDDNTTLDATTQAGGFPIRVQGNEQVVAASLDGLTITSSGNVVIGLGFHTYAWGIVVDGGSGNLITGVDVRDNGNGIQVRGAVAAGNVLADSTVSDNARFGGTGVAFINTTDATVTGSTIIGNRGSGVFIQGTDQVTVTDNLVTGNGNNGIGTSATSSPAGIASGNTITGNLGDGIQVQGLTRELTITRNTIFDNAELGINLFSSSKTEDEFGVTSNDSNDRDSGANELMNYPERMSATDDGTATMVEGRLDHPQPTSVTMEFFTNDTPDPSGHGEGEQFVATATPDAKGRLTATLPAGLAGQWITATATDAAGNTSEFSEAVQVAVPRQ